MIDPKQIKGNYFKNSISRRLTLYILFFSSAITLVGTSFQLYLDYSEDLNFINDSMHQVQTSHLQGIINNLWVSDSEHIETELTSMLNLPDMQHIQIVKDEKTLYSFGIPQTDNIISQNFPLEYQFKGKFINLGTLYVVASLNGVYQRLYDKVLVILMTQAIKTFLVSFFILFVFYYLVGRHLFVLASYAKTMDVDHLDNPLIINRGKNQDNADELSTVTTAINAMRINLKKDINARHKIEEKLRLSEEKFRTLVEDIPGTVYRCDIEAPWRVSYISEEISSLSGYSHSEFVNNDKVYGDIILPEDADKVENAVQQGVKNKQPFEVEYRIRHANGTLRWVFEKGQAVLDDKGHTHWLDGVIFDITELKKIETAYREAEEKYQELFNKTSDAVMVFDAENLMFEAANPKTLSLYGYSHDEFLDIMITDLSAEPDKTIKVIEKIRNAQTSQEFPGEIKQRKFKRKDGTVFLGEVSIGVFTTENRQKIIASVRDITERVNLEDQLRQAHKMEAIGTMAGGIAHDFNNILAAIIGYAEMAYEDIPDFGPAKHDIEQILKAGNRAKDLVTHILTFSRMPGQTQDSGPVDLSPILKEILKFQRSIIPTTIDIISNIDENCGQIHGEAIQVHQIIMNLCTNAAHSMEEKGGTLEIGLHKTELALIDLKTEPSLLPGDYIQLSIRDTGSGLTPELIERIFDPYFTTKEVGKGSGMGLAVVQGIVKKHGGFIKVESEFGKSSTFNVFFPRIEEKIISENTDKTEDIPTGTESILLVDDEMMLADVGKAMLERLGYSVTTRTDSTEAAELFKSDPNQFDLVITDQTMPNIPGSELSKQLLQIRPDIPIILCTGYSNIIDEIKAQDIGIREFTMKPVNRNCISRLIRKVLDDNESTN